MSWICAGREVKGNLQNIKSILRKEAREKKAESKKSGPTTTAAAVQAPRTAPVSATTDSSATSPLEQLEERIDDCMMMARQLDAEGLQEVIRLLRRARNAVVWKQGE